MLCHRLNSMGHYGNLMETKIQVSGNYFIEPMSWETMQMDKHRFEYLLIKDF